MKNFWVTMTTTTKLWKMRRRSLSHRRDLVLQLNLPLCQSEARQLNLDLLERSTLKKMRTTIPRTMTMRVWKFPDRVQKLPPRLVLAEVANLSSIQRRATTRTLSKLSILHRVVETRVERNKLFFPLMIATMMTWKSSSTLHLKRKPLREGEPQLRPPPREAGPSEEALSAAVAVPFPSPKYPFNPSNARRRTNLLRNRLARKQSMSTTVTTRISPPVIHDER
mmetsp:Transcript_21371/g.37601  ORF Transcript_21371/g.37601 Transcript_21371/m.37601 type:complete len:223 (+) Transcript_21371:276-944(+)